MKEEPIPNADLERVEAATHVLVNSFLKYLGENPTPMTDVFMIIHNFHKRMVREVALRWATEGIQPKDVFRMADMTFRRAMREMREQALTPTPLGPVPQPSGTVDVSRTS